MPLAAVPEPPSRPSARSREAKPGTPPAHLSPASKKWYRSIVDEYELGPQHFRVLRLAGEAFDRGQQAREIVDAEGITIRDRFGVARPHPAVAIERDCRLAVARLIRELALDDGPDPDVRPPRRGGR